MERNGAGLPFFALLFAAALFLAGWLDGRFVGQLAGHPLDSLTVGQIAMYAFGMLLLCYGAIGFLSVWFEGRELRPGRRVPRPGRAVVVAGLLTAIALAAAAGFFVRLIAHGLTTGPVRDVVAGSTVAALFLLGAVLLSLHKKYVMPQEVRTEDEDDEVPW